MALPDPSQRDVRHEWPALRRKTEVGGSPLDPILENLELAPRLKFEAQHPRASGIREGPTRPKDDVEPADADRGTTQEVLDDVHPVAGDLPEELQGDVHARFADPSHRPLPFGEIAQQGAGRRQRRGRKRQRNEETHGEGKRNRDDETLYICAMERASRLQAGPTLAIPRSELVYHATRSGGPGGQHVNKTSTRIELWWNVLTSTATTDAQRAVLQTRLAGKLDQEGWLRLVESGSRSQLRNREEVTARFLALLTRALTPRKERRRTAVPGRERRKRLDAKRLRGGVKRLRGKVRGED